MARITDVQQFRSAQVLGDLGSLAEAEAGITTWDIGSGGAAEPLALTIAVQLALTAAAASLGECRMDQPYAPLYPVIDADGNFKWC